MLQERQLTEVAPPPPRFPPQQPHRVPRPLLQGLLPSLPSSRLRCCCGVVAASVAEQSSAVATNDTPRGARLTYSVEARFSHATSPNYEAS